ncbi:MAG: dienelactone hydrolase family protein, partial [Chloroflexi bacterium]|nr:dienelactone hydrolase family protein [Chloroflexota bacterium]
MAIFEELVTISGQKPLPAFTARPSDAEPHPAVLVIFEIFGLNDHIRGVVRRLAEAGFTAMAPDFFRHDPVPYTDFPGARTVASQ